MTIPFGRAPQLPDKNAYTNQMQFLQMRQLIAQLMRDMSALRQGILSVTLSTNDKADLFDLTGLGKTGKRYAGWAICNGNNGTPSLDAVFSNTTTLMWVGK